MYVGDGMVVLFLLLAVCYQVSGISSEPCGPNEFPCNDGSCIAKTLWCDTKINCHDDSDEDFCFRRTENQADPNKCMKNNFFLCKDGPCIPLIGKCDGLSSCPDNSDEENCGTSTTYAPTEMVINITSQTTKIQPPSTNSPEFKETTSLPFTTTKQSISYEIEMHDVQSDSNAPNSVKTKDADITNGFAVDTHYTSRFIRLKSSAVQWILSTRDQDYGWGEETARAITALYLSNPQPLTHHSEENMLMAKQLHLKLSVALIRNQTKEMPLSELASYINALHATCDNPRNFHGHDLVEKLRYGTTIAQKSGEFVSPSVYISLCISNATSFSDLKKIQEVLFGTLKVDKIGVQALVTLAAACMFSIQERPNPHLEQQIARKMLRKVKELGMPDNIYELALAIQALNEAKVNQDLWNRSDALHKLSLLQQQNGSFGDVLATYYALPVLSGKSIASLSTHCYKDDGMVPVEVLMNGHKDRDSVTYSLYFFEGPEVSQTLRIKVWKHLSILDIMRIAASANSIYRFKMDMSLGKPTVYAIGDIVNDPEQGLYWTLYIHSQNSADSGKYIPYVGDIRTYIPAAGTHLVFWLKRMY